MTKFSEQHLESISVHNLMEFKKEAFIPMCSASGINVKCGRVDLGVNATGQYVVKLQKEKLIFDNAADAILKYSEYFK